MVINIGKEPIVTEILLIRLEWAERMRVLREWGSEGKGAEEMGG